MTTDKTTRLMGPPQRGPWVRVEGIGVSLVILLNANEDREILRMALEMAERRRYGRQEETPNDL